MVIMQACGCRISCSQVPGEDNTFLTRWKCEKFMNLLRCVFLSLNILSIRNHLNGLSNFSLSVDAFPVCCAEIHLPATDNVCRREDSVFTQLNPICFVLFLANHSDSGNFLSRKSSVSCVVVNFTLFSHVNGIRRIFFKKYGPSEFILSWLKNRERMKNYYLPRLGPQALWYLIQTFTPQDAIFQ